MVFRVAHADAIDAIPHDGFRRTYAVEHDRLKVGDILRRESGTGGFDRVNSEAHGRSDDDVLIHHVDHARDGCKPILHLFPDSESRCRIWMRYLNLDRLGRPSEVADQVFENVGKLNLDGWLARHNPVADLVRHFRQRATRKAPQLHEKVAGVGLGYGQRKAGPCASGVALNLGRLEKDLLDVPKNAVCLLERRSRRHYVVEDEGPLVDFGQEAATKLKVDCSRSRKDEHQGEPDQTGMLQGPCQQPIVALRDRSHEPTLALLLSFLQCCGLLSPHAKDMGRQDRRQEDRQEQ